jgi:hypothetical protein
MKIPALVTAAVFALGCSAVSAECPIPEAPAVPDGSTSDKDAFMAGYQRAKSYLANGDAYLKCLELEERAEAEAGNASDESQAARLKLYNATVDQMQQLGKKLNKEVRQFKARTDQ